MDDSKTNIENTEVSCLSDDKKHDVCPNCSRKTIKDDYVSLKNGKETKTCLKCRNSVKKSLQKIKANKQPMLKNNECINELMAILKRTDVELTEDEQIKFLVVLDKMSKKIK